MSGKQQTRKRRLVRLAKSKGANDVQVAAAVLMLQFGSHRAAQRFVERLPKEGQKHAAAHR